LRAQLAALLDPPPTEAVSEFNREFVDRISFPGTGLNSAVSRFTVMV
jgi:hypothetical protein